MSDTAQAPRTSAALAGFAALAMTACSVDPPPTVWLDTPRARVTAIVERDGTHWRVRNVEAVALGEVALASLHMRVFHDANGNAEVEDGEERGSWALENEAPSRELNLKGHLSWSELDDSPSALWRIETRVAFDRAATDEDREVRSAFDD